MSIMMPENWKEWSERGALRVDESYQRQFGSMCNVIQRDVKISNFKSTIQLFKIDFYAYGRQRVFKTIDSGAAKAGIATDTKENIFKFGEDLYDIIFIWLVRGTNFQRIKRNLSDTVKARTDELISRYDFRPRRELKEGVLERLSDDTLTISRICDIFPMRVLAVWMNSNKKERSDFCTFTDLNAEERVLVRPFHCPALPYFCSKTVNCKQDISMFHKN